MREQLNSSQQTLNELRETRENRRRNRNGRITMNENIDNILNQSREGNNTNSNTPALDNGQFSTYILPTGSNINDNDIASISVPTSIINQECEIIPYSSLDDSQDICPIDRVPFESTENVMRIRFCGHIFREENLRENFRSRSTCPVCRHNIITTITHNQRFHRRENNDASLNNFLPDIEWFVRY